MHRHLLTVPRTALATALAFVVSLLLATSGAQAVMVDMSGSGRAEFGVALAPGTQLTPPQLVTSSTPCTDPWLSSDLVLPANGLCWQGGTTGAVMHGNETFALTWDPNRSYWAGTRHYVEQFLRDVADGSGTLTSPYAVTTQYNDPGGRASNASLYGGGCIDFGNPGGATCVFNHSVDNTQGNQYPGCPNGDISCIRTLTDTDLQAQMKRTIAAMGLVGRVQPGFTPLLVMLTPQQVEVCLDSAHTLCSANGNSSAQFCSYHSWFTVPDGTPAGRRFAYVVQPWTAGTSCDDPNVQVNKDEAIDAGSRLVSPLSQGQIAAIVNPWLSGWSAQNGSEINDNLGCRPSKGDAAIVGTSSQNPYSLQREFSNAGVLENEPNAPWCALGVRLSPSFVVPSPIDQGDLVAFDGSVTDSSLMVPGANYAWSFGDGKTDVGPSVVHSYAKGGTYSVTLTVTDRGGNTAKLSQPIVVLGPTGQPVPPQPPPPPAFRVRMQIMPQSMRAMLRSGVAVSLSSNQAADGIATLSISRSAARRAHIASARGSSVVIGRGTVSGVKSGSMKLRFGLSRATAAKLKRLGHVTLTVRLSLVGADGSRAAIVAAGRY
jgi:hypothetical protein